MIDAKTPILVVCPSRKRPRLAWRMYESMMRCKEGAVELFLYVASDDPYLAEYLIWLREQPGVILNIGPRLPIVQVYNNAALTWAADRDLYMEINDDHLFHTHGWDTKLKQRLIDNGGSGCVFPQHGRWHSDWTDADVVSEQLNVGAELITGDCIRRLGHWYHPSLFHLGADEYIKDIYGNAGLLFGASDVWVEHIHFSNGYSNTKDDNIQEIYHEPSASHDARRNMRLIRQDMIDMLKGKEVAHA